jgi:hypothetical protein
MRHVRASQRKKYWERILALSLEIHLLFDVLHRSFYLLQTTEALNNFNPEQRTGPALDKR